jgi:Acetyltransferase (GNAT) domain
LVALIEGLRARRPRYALLHFEPLAADAALSGDLAAALRDAGLVTRRYFRFGNWYDDTRGLPFRDYLAGRPGALRNTFRRNGARLARAGRLRLLVVQDAAVLADGLAHYEQVYAASWKRAEPHPAFIRRLAAGLAAAGALRLGLLYLDHRPVAAQLWIVWHGRAILYKLAHDPGYDAFSPGTVLTMHMLERLLDGERIAELDLGAGDDRYKRLWATKRRARVGLVAFDPLTLHGRLGILRHILLPRVRRSPDDVIGSCSRPK